MPLHAGPQNMKTNEVFGVSNQPIKTYVERQKVDALFVDGLTRNKHIIVYGASKQGKTSLTNKHLKPDDFVRVNCSYDARPADLYKAILRTLQIEFQESKEISKTTGDAAKLTGSASVKIPFMASGEVTGEVSGKSETTTKRNFRSVEYNFNLAQDIAEILRAYKFDRRIIPLFERGRSKAIGD